MDFVLSFSIPPAELVILIGLLSATPHIMARRPPPDAGTNAGAKKPRRKKRK